MTVERDLGTIPLRAAIESRDLGAIVDSFAPDAVLHSPLTEKFRFTGRAQIGVITEIILDLFEDLYYTEEARVGDVGFLVSRARVGGQEIETVDHIRFNAAGQIQDITLFFRPLPATATALRLIGRRLARRQSATRGVLVSALARPLAFMVRAGDGIGVKLVGAGI